MSSNLIESVSAVLLFDIQGNAGKVKSLDVDSIAAWCDLKIGARVDKRLVIGASNPSSC